MNMDHDNFQPHAPRVQNRIGFLTAALFWLAGVGRQDMRRQSERTRLKLAALGLAFGIGLVVLVFAWVHVGMTYFGWIGVLVPGIAVPAAMVLGLDRLIAMQSHRLHAELAPYNRPEAAEEAEARKSQKRARLAVALVFSGVTVYTLLLSFSQDGIRQAQRDAANNANAKLRQTYEQRAHDEYELQDHALGQRLGELQAERARLVAEGAQADAQGKTAEAAALQAQTDAAKEAGGLDSRETGTGPKYRAQREIEAHQQAAAAKQQLKAVETRQRIDGLDQGVKDVNEQRHALKSTLDATLRAVPEAIKADPTYVPVKSGLFADSSAFIRLYADPEEGLGHWVLTLLGAPFLFALECVPLLALALYGSSPFDVYRIAHNRAEAAAAVAESEVDIARRRAAMPPVGVVYPRPAAAAQGPAAAGPAKPVEPEQPAAGQGPAP